MSINLQNLDDNTLHTIIAQIEAAKNDRVRASENCRMYKMAMDNLRINGRIVNMHGDHVWNIGHNEPQAFQIPPNQVVVIMAPQGTVIRGDQQQDTANWLFFKQKLWAMAATSGTSNNCYGADGPFSSFVKDPTLNEIYDPPDDEDTVIAEDIKDTAAGRIKERNIKAQKKVEEEKEKASEELQRENGKITEDEWDDFVYSPFHNIGVDGTVNSDGKELLWHVQIFFGGDPTKYGTTDYDGDWCYNQRHLFEMEPSIGRNGPILDIDKTFNIWKLGNPTCHMKEGFSSNGGELPLGASLEHLDNKSYNNVPTISNIIKAEEQLSSDDLEDLWEIWNGDDMTQDIFYQQHPWRYMNGSFYKINIPIIPTNMVDPIFNLKGLKTGGSGGSGGTYDGLDTLSYYHNTNVPTGVHKIYNTTEKIVNLYYQTNPKNPNLPGMTVFSSCSPAADTSKSWNSDKNAPELGLNMILRNYIIELGRKHLCTIRGELLRSRQNGGGPFRLKQGVLWADGCSTFVPQYKDHKGIAIAMNDDRELFYIQLGQQFQAIQEGAVGIISQQPTIYKTYHFTPRTFRTFFNIANSPSFYGRAMERFKKQYDRWWHGKIITRGNYKGENWNSARSIAKYKLLPFNHEAVIAIESNKGRIPNDFLLLEKTQRIEFMKTTVWGTRILKTDMQTQEIQQLLNTSLGGGRKRRKKTKKKNRKKGNKQKTKRKKYRRRKNRKTKKQKIRKK